MAVANYRSAYKSYPPAFVCDESGNRMHSWRVLLLPFVEKQELYKRYDFSQPWNSPKNLELATQMPSTYCASGTFRKGETVATNYLAIVGESTFWKTTADGQTAIARKHKEITDDIDKTFLFVENQGIAVHWMSPYDLEFDSMSFEFDDPNGISSQYIRPAGVTVRGSTLSLEPQITPETIRAMATATGGETVDTRFIRGISDGRQRAAKSDTPIP